MIEVWQAVAAGFIMGILSAGHCMGMCGPIAFFIGSNQKFPGRVMPVVWLAAGKMLAYGWIGLVFGAAGHMLTRWTSWIGASRALPALWGVLLIFAGLQISGRLPRLPIPGIARLEKRLADFARSFQVPRQPASLFAAGILWGFLPCPMVLVPALGAAVAAGAGQAEGALKGFFMMAGFGAGTFPALALSGTGGAALLNTLRSKSNPAWIGMGFAAAGVLAILFSFGHGGGSAHCAAAASG